MALQRLPAPCLLLFQWGLCLLGGRETLRPWVLSSHVQRKSGFLSGPRHSAVGSVLTTCPRAPRSRQRRESLPGAHGFTGLDPQISTPNMHPKVHPHAYLLHHSLPALSHHPGRPTRTLMTDPTQRTGCPPALLPSGVGQPVESWSKSVGPGGQGGRGLHRAAGLMGVASLEGGPWSR